jgi:hypothetical protein
LKILSIDKERTWVDPNPANILVHQHYFVEWSSLSLVIRYCSTCFTDLFLSIAIHFSQQVDYNIHQTGKISCGKFFLEESFSWRSFSSENPYHHGFKMIFIQILLGEQFVFLILIIYHILLAFIYDSLDSRLTVTWTLPLSKTHDPP